MNEIELATTCPTTVLVVVPTGRNTWARKEATLHYQASRLIKADGIDLPKAGPLGLTGTIYLVKDSFFRDNRPVMRVERQKIVNGKMVDTQNWGEIEETAPRAAA